MITDLAQIKELCSALLSKRDCIVKDPLGPMANLEPFLAPMDMQSFGELPGPGEGLERLGEQEPAFKNLQQSTLLALRRLVYDGAATDVPAQWGEALLRFCEIKLRGLKTHCRRQWGRGMAARLGLLHVCAFFLDCYHDSKDMRYLSAALKIADLKWLIAWRRLADCLKGEADELTLGCFGLRISLQMAHALNALASERPTCAVVDKPAKGQGDRGKLVCVDPDIAQVTRKRQWPKASPPRVCVFSPSRYSLYTLAVTELLLRGGVEVPFVFVRKLLNFKRLRFEIGWAGRRVFKKIWAKLVLRKHYYSPEPFETLSDLMDGLEIRHRTIDELCKTHSVGLRYCRTLNDPDVLDGLADCRPDIVVFTGGGLIRQPVLDNAGDGVVNCHMGVLPSYRGMDVVEWPIAEGRMSDMGFSVHFMARGVDTGPIIRVQYVGSQPGLTIAQLRRKFEPLMVRAIVGASLDYLEGTVTPQTQLIEDGKQYFMIHPLLRHVAEKRYSQYVRSLPED
ncbi:hypothetical protein LCGC14_1882650 [marine sediment metagenome]|uniref:phosphoribosylglycinamide formyltransferase 1 n=1 Tax=marine sediment metagenome TaxID=412755 RepID=A0A0F9GQ41_9ZZZZ